MLSRDRAKARLAVGERAAILEGDVTCEKSVVAALHGVAGVIISLSAFTPKLISKQRLIERDSVLMTLALAEKERVSRIVYLSGYDVCEDLSSELDFPIRGWNNALPLRRLPSILGAGAGPGRSPTDLVLRAVPRYRRTRTAR